MLAKELHKLRSEWTWAKATEAAREQWRAEARRILVVLESTSGQMGGAAWQTLEAKQVVNNERRFVWLEENQWTARVLNSAGWLVRQRHGFDTADAAKRWCEETDGREGA